MIGKVVHDYALGRNGIVVDGHFTEDGQADGQTLEWEWLVLYDDGELQGADTNDLQAVENENR
jgi:hypothetical protein